MKGSKILLIFVFLVTAGLGGVAIWIGWRLSQEEEVTPGPGEALPETGSGYEENFYCSDFDGACSRSNDHYYSSKDETKNKDLPCASFQLDNPSDGKFETRRMGPDSRRQKNVDGYDPNGSKECSSSREEFYNCYSEGYSSEDQFDMASCTSCKNIELVETPTSTSVVVKAYSRNVGPRIKYDEKEHTTVPNEKWAYFHGDSISEFRFRLLDENGNTISGVSDVLILENSTEYSQIVCNKISNPTDCLKWGKLNSGQCYYNGEEIGFEEYEPEDKIYECEYTHTWDLTNTPLAGGTYMVEVSARMVNNHFNDSNQELWRHPDMQISGSNVYYEIPYKIDVDGDGSVDDGPYTYRQLYNPNILKGDAVGMFNWLSDESNTCIKTFDIGEKDLSCDALTARDSGGTDLGSTINMTQGVGGTYTLTTQVGGTQAVSTYEYDATYGTASGSTASGSWVITDSEAAALTPGTYDNAIWVTISGGGLSDGGPGSVCTIDLVVQEEGECDCESITRSPSSDEIAAGSDVWFQITDSCELEYSEVSWYWSEGEDGTAQTTNFSDRVPGPSDEAAYNHSVIFSVPDDASGTLCVWARTQGVDDPDCKECFSVGGEEEPAFAAVKTSEVVCINNNTAARVTYTINVRNISDVVGVIEYVEDTYDSRIQSSWVSNITPTPDSHSGNVIRWDNNDNGYTLQPNDGASGGDDEMEFSYIVTIPSDYFGSYQDGVFVPYDYTNVAIVKPQEQDSIELTTVVNIICAIPTGIMDKAVRSLLLGLLFIILGAIALRMHGYTYKYLEPVESRIKNAYGGVKNTVRSAVSRIYERIHDRFKLSKKERFEKGTVRKIENRKRKTRLR